jgi:hypothetical protein
MIATLRCSIIAPIRLWFQIFLCEQWFLPLMDNSGKSFSGLRQAGFVEPVVFAFAQAIDAIADSINPVDENSIWGVLRRLLLESLDG